jgi:hypothetical protein
VYVPDDPNVSTQGSFEADLGVEETGAVVAVDLVAGVGGGMGGGAGGVVEATEAGATKR